MKLTFAAGIQQFKCCYFWNWILDMRFLEDFILPKQLNINPLPQLEGERSGSNFNNPAPFQLCFVQLEWGRTENTLSFGTCSGKIHYPLQPNSRVKIEGKFLKWSLSNNFTSQHPHSLTLGDFQSRWLCLQHDNVVWQWESHPRSQEISPWLKEKESKGWIGFRQALLQIHSREQVPLGRCYINRSQEKAQLLMRGEKKFLLPWRRTKKKV